MSACAAVVTWPQVWVEENELGMWIVAKKPGNFPPTRLGGRKHSSSGHWHWKTESKSHFASLAVWLCIGLLPSLRLSLLSCKIRLLLFWSCCEDWIGSYARSPSILVLGVLGEDSVTDCHYHSVLWGEGLSTGQGHPLLFLSVKELPLGWAGTVWRWPTLCHQSQSEKLFKNTPVHTGYTSACKVRLLQIVAITSQRGSVGQLSTAPQAVGLRWIQKDTLTWERSEPGLPLTFPSKEQRPNLSWAPAVGQLVLPLLFIL